MTNAASLLMIDLSGPRLTPDEREFLLRRRPGGLCLFARNVVDRFQLADFIAEARSLAGEELLIATDQEGGGVVRILDLPYPPGAMALGAADDLELTRSVAGATGHGLAALGINVDFAPVADVNSNPANPVIADRSFGAEPQLVARHVAAFTGGLQGAGVAATVKHFPGHGDVDIDSHLALPTLPRDIAGLEELEWPPFRAAIKAGVAAVMTGHIVLSRVDPELPATLSRKVVTGLLRERLGFDGVVFSDALEMRAIADRWGGAQAAPLALAAGVDMAAQVATVKGHEETVAAMEAAIAEGRLAEEDLERSLARLSLLRRRFPASTALAAGGAAAAWREGDERLLEEAARRALVATGPLPVLGPGSSVLLVAAGGTLESAATQATVRPAAQLVDSLRERGVSVEHVEYRSAAAEDSWPRIAAALGGAEVAIFASSTRTALSPEEAALATRLAAAAASYMHVALWNPYAVEFVPGPALVTFGWRPRSIGAVADLLLGHGEASGTAPVPLTPPSA